MTVMEFFGCALLAFGPPFAMFAFTIASDPIRIIILIASAFFWLLSLLMSSIVWFAVVPLRQTLAFGMVFSVLLQELFRFLFYKLLRKAEGGLQRVTENNTTVLTNQHILPYVSGLGFGVMSGAFSLVNVLADSVGPGTVGLKGDSQIFFLTSAATTVCFILLHTAWSVLFFHSLDKRLYLQLGFVIFSHLLVSSLTLLNQQGLYYITLPSTYLLLVVAASWAFKVAGGSLVGLRDCFCCMRTTVKFEVSAE